MLKIVSIDHIEPYQISCSFNNGFKKLLDVKPLLLNHKHLHGIDLLWDHKIFLTASIGDFGEVLWKNIISPNQPVSNEALWDYDISPEFFFFQGKDLNRSFGDGLDY